MWTAGMTETQCLLLCILQSSKKPDNSSTWKTVRRMLPVTIIYSRINPAACWEIRKTSLSKQLFLISVQELNQAEYGPFVCGICTFCALKPRVTPDIVLRQSLSSSSLCIRLMMLWVTQAANQPNQYTYNSSGGFLSEEWRTCCDNNTGKIEICGQMAVGPR